MNSNTSAIHGLYAITDPALTPADTLLPACEAALKGGARLIQYRDKTADAATQLETARHLKGLCERYDAKLLINDSFELALQSGAHGVHLGQSDGSISHARQALGKAAIIGVTCHGKLALAHKAELEGADYVAFGRFFPSHTKPHAPGAELAILNTDLTVPKVAIGGINPDNAARVIGAGAHAIAVIHGLFAQSSLDAIENTARQLAQLFQSDINQ